MKIAVQFAGNLPREIADVWYENIRKYMKHPIVHLTDMTTESFWFADEVQRIDEQDIPMAKYRHLSTIKGDVLSLDYDIVVQKDISDVFNRPFDIALTKRKAKKDFNEMLYLGSPHNTGVVWTRNNEFWKICAERYKLFPKEQQWMIGQINITECAHIYRKKFKIIELPAFLYNYSPDTKEEDVSKKYVVHYKGTRKYWMVNTKAAFDEGNRVVSMTSKGLTISQDHPNLKRLMKLQREKNEHN